MWIDIHTHLLPPAGVRAVVNRAFGAEWPDYPVFSAGLHPWFLRADTLAGAQEWLLEQLEQPGCAAVGEAGLDKQCDTDWALQKTAFQFCIDCSERLQKPLVIHCVRAFEEVLSMGKTRRSPWIFHGFNKKRPVAEQILKAGGYLSFGAALLRPSHPAAEALRHCPDDRFLLETDGAAAPDIREVYAAAARIRGVAPEQVAEWVERNVERVFGGRVAGGV